MNIRGLVSQFDLNAAEVAGALRIQGGRTTEPAGARPARPAERSANGARSRRRPRFRVVRARMTHDAGSWSVPR
jgi:hypothetical protein